MNMTALPLKSRERPGGGAAGPAFDLFHDAHKTSAPTLNKAAALTNWRAQIAYLNRSIAAAEAGSAPAKAPKAVTKTVTKAVSKARKLKTNAA